MRIRHGEKFRWDMCNHPASKNRLVVEFDIKVHQFGKLKAKVLIFRSMKALQQFWLKLFGYKLSRLARGIVQDLGFSKPNIRFVDPTFFCVIGLVKGHLKADVIAHEAVHAAACYNRRVKRNTFGKGCNCEEERLAYPTGFVTSELAWHLKRLGF